MGLSHKFVTQLDGAPLYRKRRSRRCLLRTPRRHFCPSSCCVRRTAVATARGSVVACAATLPCFFRPNRLIGWLLRPAGWSRCANVVVFSASRGGDAGGRRFFGSTAAVMRGIGQSFAATAVVMRGVGQSFAVMAAVAPRI